MTGYGESVIDFSTGDRVELHPATDLWMQGARYGNVLKPRQYHNTTMVSSNLIKSVNLFMLCQAICEGYKQQPAARNPVAPRVYNGSCT